MSYCVQIRAPGSQAWAGASAERFLTTARAWSEARQWEQLGFEVRVVRTWERSGFEVTVTEGEQ